MLDQMIAPFRDRRFVASLISSTLVNLTALLILSVITIGAGVLPEDLQFESLLSDDDDKPEERIQVLQENDRVATTLNTTPGGIVSTTVNTKSRPTKAAQLTPINDDFNNVDVNAPSPTTEGIGRDQFSIDIGEEEFKGEPTAIVNGYGDALNRITQELIRLLRKDKLMVIWLFDESESMKDDQKEIANNFHVVYKELRILEQKNKLPKGRKPTKQQIGRANAKAPMLTAVYGFGDKLNKLLDPTTDADAIIKTISEKVSVDETGKEHMCTSIVEAIGRHRTLAARQRRKVVVIVVSDESGDDGKAIETTLRAAKRSKTPLYFLGRESMFGYPYARQRWIDPDYKLPHWIRINRGPENVVPPNACNGTGCTRGGMRFRAVSDRTSRCGWRVKRTGFSSFYRAKRPTWSAPVPRTSGSLRPTTCASITRCGSRGRNMIARAAPASFGRQSGDVNR